MNPSHSGEPQKDPRKASGAAPQAQPGDRPPVHRSAEPHAGDHLSQYGMRSTGALPGALPAQGAPEHIHGLQTFDDEYSTREARDPRPRSIPTGAQEQVDGRQRPKLGE
jgi:hypothetical protein